MTNIYIKTLILEDVSPVIIKYYIDLLNNITIQSMHCLITSNVIAKYINCVNKESDSYPYIDNNYNHVVNDIFNKNELILFEHIKETIGN